jgi:hypothetical protein
VKRLIQVIRLIDYGIIIAAIALIVMMIRGGTEGVLLIAEALILLPFMITFFIKKSLINRQLQRSKYPGVFIDVMEKLQMTRNMELRVEGDWLEEVYKPPYATAQFLNDNRLHKQIRTSSLNAVITYILLLAAFLMWQLFLRRYNPGDYLVLVLAIAFCLYLFLQWFRDFYPVGTGPVQIEFTEAALIQVNSPPFEVE